MFDIGKVVQLKSGGPYMTVNSEPDGKNEVICVWFLSDEFKSASFHPDALQDPSDSGDW